MIQGKWVTIILVLLFASATVRGQYVVNGNAEQLSCNCYRLTQAIDTQSGSVWNSNQLNLNTPFDFTFNVYLGSNDEGADGIAFVLQPISTSIGSTGGGLGYQGIDPSLSVEIDTYTNGWDPVYDHVAIMANGDVNHSTPNNLVGPASALANNANIEDGQEHLLRVAWNPTTQTMQVYIDALLRVEYTGDIITDIFSDDPMVFWGFTGSTGGLNNEQRFCLSILPGLEQTESLICAGNSVLIRDSSYSALGSVVEWDWDFNNGQTSQLENPGEITFSDPGQYYIIQSVVDAAGCGATDSTLITVAPNPIADFSNTEVCFGNPTEFLDESDVQSGNITQWEWDFGTADATSNSQSPQFTYLSSGTFETTLLVTTANGCVDSVTNTISVDALPTAEVMHESNSLDASFSTALGDEESAQWILSDTTIFGASFNLTFPDSGWYNVQLVVTNQAGCTDTLSYDFYLEGIPEFIVSNVFTPNGDMVNDLFEPYTYAITSVQFRIYNRWGRPVYDFDGPLQDGVNWGWDGSINGGAEAAAGTYYFMLDLVGTDAVQSSRTGAVTLIR
jgi:gliding motility-associated-like protein